MPITRPLLGGYTGEDPSSQDVQAAHCPPMPCNALGIKIANSAIEFEDSLGEYLHCQCQVIEKLLCTDQESQIVPMLRSFKENLEQVCCIETQLIEKLDKGLSISHCEEEG